MKIEARNSMVETATNAFNTSQQASAQPLRDKARSLRPFYFIVVVWGERYTDFLLNFCIPSLLSPNNIPALANRGKNKFLIATTDEDWESMQARPIFRLLKEYVEPVFIRIPPCPEGVSQCVHMGIGHKLATHMAFVDRAYAAVLTPDMMVSDGTFAAAQKHAANGIQVVLVAALRFGEEPLFENLEKLGIASARSRFGDEGRPLIASGRQFVHAGLRSFHSETLRYEWEKPCFASFPSAVWWRVDDEGIIVHSLSWAPLLVDYDAVEHHDSWTLDNWTIDGDYVYRNFGIDGKIHVVRDSDETMLISWAPLEDRRQSLEPTQHAYTYPIIGKWIKGSVLNMALANPIFDPLKINIFPTPVYWHATEINVKKWKSVEAKAIRVIRLYGGDSLAAGLGAKVSAGVDAMTQLRGGFHGAPVLPVLPVGRGFQKVLYACQRLTVFIINARTRLTYIFIRVPVTYASRLAGFVFYYWNNRAHVLELASAALKGDLVARQRVRRSLRFFGKLIRGSKNVYDES